VLTSLVQSIGLRCTCVANPEMALRMLRFQMSQSDIVLLPGDVDEDFPKRMRRHAPLTGESPRNMERMTIPLVVISDQVEESFEYAACLPHPINVNSLRFVVYTLLAGRQTVVPLDPMGDLVSGKRVLVSGWLSKTSRTTTRGVLHSLGFNADFVNKPADAVSLIQPKKCIVLCACAWCCAVLRSWCYAVCMVCCVESNVRSDTVLCSLMLLLWPKHSGRTWREWSSWVFQPLYVLPHSSRDSRPR